MEYYLILGVGLVVVTLGIYACLPKGLKRAIINKLNNL